MSQWLHFKGVEIDISFSMSFLILKGANKMQKLKVLFTNELNVNIFDKDFYLLLFNSIIDLQQKKEEEHAL